MKETIEILSNLKYDGILHSDERRSLVTAIEALELLPTLVEKLEDAVQFVHQENPRQAAEICELIHKAKELIENGCT
jgi:predicted house-cleaning noncanonical NTP pyrophosphatase (MazG superfamily)